MRLFSFAILFVGLTFAEGNSPTVAELEAMERYASQPTAHVTWSAHVDRIEGGQSSAVFTAVVLADNTQLPRQMRGVRIDFSTEGIRATIYVHQEFAERVIGGLDEVVSLSPSFLSRYATSSSRCFGSGVFLNQMRAGAHFLSVSQCEMSDGWNGLSVWTADGTFRFTDLDPTPFAQAIRRAMDELKKR